MGFWLTEVWEGSKNPAGGSIVAALKAACPNGLDIFYGGSNSRFINLSTLT